MRKNYYLHPLPRLPHPRPLLLLGLPHPPLPQDPPHPLPPLHLRLPHPRRRGRRWKSSSSWRQPHHPKEYKNEYIYRIISL